MTNELFPKPAGNISPTAEVARTKASPSTLEALRTDRCRYCGSVEITRAGLRLMADSYRMCWPCASAWDWSADTWTVGVPCNSKGPIIPAREIIVFPRYWPDGGSHPIDMCEGDSPGRDQYRTRALHYLSTGEAAAMLAQVLAWYVAR